MKLCIDSENARTSCVGDRFRDPVARDGLVLLEVEVEPQGLEHWCWAAIAVGLGRYYGTCSTTQAEVASQILETDCRRFEDDEAVRDRANATTKLHRVLAAVGCYSHWSAGKPLFDRVRFEINLGRPLAARIGWHAGAAHYVLVHGYRAAGERVLVADPLHGPGQYPLADFPARYRFGGAWTETFWTTPGPPLGDLSLTPTGEPTHEYLRHRGRSQQGRAGEPDRQGLRPAGGKEQAVQGQHHEERRSDR